MDALNFCIKEIAYDNGAVFRGQTEKDVLDHVWLKLVRSSTNEDGFTIAQLNIVEDVLSTLTEDELIAISTDTPEEGKDVVTKHNISPETWALIDEVLNHAFDHI